MNESFIFGFQNHSASQYTFVYKFPSIESTRLMLYYCIVESKHRFLSKGCKVNESDDHFGLQTVILKPNTTSYVSQKNLFKPNEIYDFGISADLKINSTWFSTGIMPLTCLFTNKNLILGNEKWMFSKKFHFHELTRWLLINWNWLNLHENSFWFFLQTDKGDKPKFVFEKSNDKMSFIIKFQKQNAFCQGDFFYTEIHINYCLLSSDNVCTKSKKHFDYFVMKCKEI